MSFTGRDRNPWRLALLLLVGAYVAVVGYLALRDERTEEAPAAKLRVVQAPYASPGTRAPARFAAGTAAPIFNPAVQKPGPPDPRAQQSAAISAEKAADAAAEIAASVMTNN